MRTLILAVSAALMLTGSGAPLLTGAASSSQAPLPADLDRLLGPIALYPDPLLAQMLMSATDPVALTALNDFLKTNSKLKGTELQDAAVKAKFEPSFVALALFPQVVKQMVATLAQTADIGKAFKDHRSAVFESIQRLRLQAHNAGTLKTTPQQEVEKKTTESGQQVIVIEPANPQVVYVPQYNPQVVYVQAPATTTVVVQESSSADAAVAGMIGFTAGIAIGAAVNNNYYYGPYGWRGGGYMYNDAWDDYYDHREDAREDWQDHREDLADERGDRAGKAQEERTNRTESRTERTGERQGTASTTKREGTAAAGTREAGTRQGTTSAATTRAGSTYESRGHSQPQERARSTTTRERSGTGSDAFSGYSGGRSERAASSRGSSSRSSSRSRSGGGGGRRR
jgi:hypothetical protein